MTLVLASLSEWQKSRPIDRSPTRPCHAWQWKRIGEMRSLTALEIPGCDVDDEVVMNWQDLKRLRACLFRRHSNFRANLFVGC